MRHDVTVEGAAFRLRPVEIADAAFILGLRTDEELSRFLHPASCTLGDQQRWIEEYLGQAADYYFVVERRVDGAAEGTAGIYDVDPERRTAEWGRWVLRRGSLAALESAALVYRAAFDVLGLEEIRCLTVADNARVVSFHQSFGLATAAVHPGRVVLAGVPHDAVEQRLTRGSWEAIRPAIEAKAARMARALA